MKKIRLLVLLVVLTTTTVYGAGRNIVEGRIGGSFNGKYKAVEENIDHSRFTLGLGYRFDF